MKHIQKKELLACCLGVLIGALFAYQIVPPDNHDEQKHGDAHQITQPDEDYHVHADFLLYVEDQKIDLSTDEYMTTAEQSLHKDAHLHDGNGEVKHIHAENITFVEFLGSLDILMTNDCITIDETQYCENDAKQFSLLVNNELYSGDYTEYVPVDDDRILIYFGDNVPEKITSFMNEVKNDSCYYSGTCPERGIAPPESCGLTCEL